MIAVKLDRLEDYVGEMRKKKSNNPIYISLEYVEGQSIEIQTDAGKRVCPHMLALIKLSTMLTDTIYLHTNIANQSTIKSEEEFKTFGEQAEQEYNKIVAEIQKTVPGVFLLRGSVGVI